ncbi:MAG: helix-turn-helix domain-containing protein [Clostridia bacterium]|nr:helix-turn-helix domain-containing protein [Clostridia bacterium]
MNEENKSNYYAIIPAVVRYDDELTDKAKLLYGEITCLSNKEGYCFATNNYFANLYHCTSRAIQIAISKLQERGYIRVVIENSYQRKIFLTDSLGYEKNFVGRYEKSFIGGGEKNFTNNNIKFNIDDLFNFIINNSNKVPTKFYNILNRLDFLYTQEILDIMQKDKIQMLKEIIYILYDLYNSKFCNLLSQVNREKLVNLYILAQEHSPRDLLNYYKKSIINEYSSNKRS